MPFIVVRCDLCKYLAVGIARLLLFSPCRRTSNRAGRLQIEPQLPQRPANKRTIGKLVLQQRMRLRTALGLNNLAIGVNLHGQARNPVGGFARLRQHFTPSGIIDPILGLDRLPKGQAMLAELARWLRRGRSWIKHGESLTLFWRKSTGRKKWNNFVTFAGPPRSENRSLSQFRFGPPARGRIRRPMRGEYGLGRCAPLAARSATA